jgi:GNAT superfamily N-acetyltransferase
MSFEKPSSEQPVQESEAVSEQTPEKMLEDIQAAHPKAEWVTYIQDKQYGATVSLPHECSISGNITYLNEENARLYIDMFQVNEKIQKGGVGTRLLKSFVAEGKDYGATELYGHITSDSALKTRARVFGKENLEFYNHYTKEKLTITFEEALASAEDGRVDYDVRVDLGKVDTSEWEVPEKVETSDKAD